MSKTDDLVIRSDTDPEEVVEFVKDRVSNPLRRDGTTIINLSTYAPDERALDDALRLKLDKDLYVIPYQVVSAHGFIMTFLPESLKEADILVYVSRDGQYRAYNSLYDDMDGVRRAEVQEELSEIMEDELNV